MLITRSSMITGVVRSKEMETVTQEKLDRWNSGELIQNVFPELTADEREFIMTGVTREEWDRFVVDQEDELDVEREEDAF
jgi:hypothetical protein